jgi:hypothetical protein
VHCRQVGVVQQRRLILTHGEHRAERLREHPAQRETDRLRGRGVEQMGVIDEQERWRLLCVGGQQAERRGPNRKAIAPGYIGSERERNLECCGARRRNAPEQMQRWAEQFVQAGERQLHLGFDASGAKQSKPGGAVLGVGEQRRLPNPRLTHEREHRTVARADGGQQAVDRRALSLTPEEHAAIVWIPRCGGLTLADLLGVPPDAMTCWS